MKLLSIDFYRSIFVVCALQGLIHVATGSDEKKEENWFSGSAKVSAQLFDTESALGSVYLPGAELGLLATSSRQNVSGQNLWAASAKFRLQENANPIDGTVSSQVRVSEASLARNFDHFSIGGGRLLLRPFSSHLNEIGKSFLRGEPAADGVVADLFVFGQYDHRAGIFIGGPGPDAFGVTNQVLARGRAVAGLRWFAGFSSLRAFVLYRIEPNRILYFPLVNAEGLITNSPRQTLSHEFEMGLRVPGESFQFESLLQFSQQGPYRTITVINTQLGEMRAGDQDATLPQEANDFRAVTQVLYRLHSDGISHDSLFFGLGARTAPRYHSGTADEKVYRQGAGSETQFVFGYQFGDSHLVAETGLGAEYASEPKYNSFASRNENGQRILTRTKLGAFISTKMIF